MNNKKSTKRALLSSVLSLVLCITMLIGTTFAWFTDNVTSAGNIIKSGTLEVTMEWAEGDEDPANASWTDASKGPIFNSQLWEPGYTEAKHIKVANVGTLALKYQMRILANGVVSELADVIDVYYFAEATQLTTRATVATGTKLGTLSEVLNNTNATAISQTIAGSLEAKESETITIALKMQESAGNEYQNLSIGTDFSIKLLATQYTSEEDTFDNTYDAKADFASQEIPSAMVSALSGDELTVALANADKTVTLDAGYQFEPTETKEQGAASDYRWWHADFAVSADGDIPGNSVTLAGYYKLYDEAMKLNGAWIDLTSSDTVEAGTEIRLIQAMGSGSITVAYKELCEYGNDGTGFRCGIVANEGFETALAGKTITVALRLYECENADIDSGVSHQAEVDPENYITVGTFTYTFPAVEVEGQDELKAAFEEGATAVELGAGTYTIPSTVAGKDVTIIGSGDSTVFDFTKVNNAKSASITFENLKIQGKDSNANYGFGIQSTTGDIVYKNCTLDGAITHEYYGTVAYYDCTFTGQYYITTYSLKSALFDNCVFDRDDSRAILVFSHGNNPVEVTIKDCEFKAAEKGYTGSGAWTAAVEVDTTNITSTGTTVTITGCTFDENYNGIVRDKSTANLGNAVIKVNDTTITNSEITTDGYGVTTD